MSERISSALWIVANITFACSFLTVIGGGLTYIWGDHDIGGKIAATGAIFFLASIVIGLGVETAPRTPNTPSGSD